MTNPVCRNVAVVIALHGSGEWIPNDAVAKSIVMTCLMLCGSAGSWPASDVSDEFSLCSPEYSDFSSTVSRVNRLSLLLALHGCPFGGLFLCVCTHKGRLCMQLI